MVSEHRFVLVDFTSPAGTGRRRYEAGRSYPTMPPAVAHAAAKRDLVSHHKPARWSASSLFAPPVVLTEAEIAAAGAELEALARHGVEVAEPVANE